MPESAPPPGPGEAGTDLSPTRNHLLACLPPQDLDLLAPHLQRVELRPGQILIEPGEVFHHIHFPGAATIVGAFARTADGGSTKTNRMTCWDAVGLIEAGGDGRAGTRADVIVPGIALRIPVARFAAVAARSAAIRAMAARHAQAVVAEITQVAVCHARHSVEQRVASWLLSAHDLACAAAGPGSNSTIPVPITQERLGNVLGVQRSTVTLTAQRLQQAGLLRYGRGRVFITDQPGLERTACECNGVIGALHRRLLAEASYSSSPGLA